MLSAEKINKEIEIEQYKNRIEERFSDRIKLLDQHETHRKSEGSHIQTTDRSLASSSNLSPKA